MAITQLPSPLSVTTPLGKAVCHFVNDGGFEVYWGCFQLDTSEMWWWRNQEIRYGLNITEGFISPSPILLTKKRMKALEPHLKRTKGK